MPSYEITGTYNGSQIERGLQNLESQIQKVASSMSRIKAPTITPTANFGSFFSEMDKAESYASKGTFGRMFSTVDFSKAGKEASAAYASSFASGFGPMGNAVSGVATALGPAGIVAIGAIAGAAVIANAAYNAAAAWQSMKTSIGRTTGLQGTELENMMNDLQSLRMEMGMTAQSAADAAEQAGSIGVGQKKFQAGDMAAYRKEIMDFVSSASMISGAWGMSNAATTEGIGAMGSVTLDNWNRQRKAMGEQEMSWSDFALKSGASVDALANSMKASEGQIVTAMTHASGSIAEFAPSEDTIGKWYALSSYLISTGASADGAGEQIKDMATYISRDAKGAISGLLGTDSAGLMAKMKADSVGTIQELGKAIAQMPDSERPDIYAAFGMTGSQGMKKIVADIENETGALDLAIDIGVKGFKTGDVKKGFDAVLAEANTQAGRIAQVFQVALEKVGTIALPAITSGMKSVADWGESVVNAGSEIYGAGQKVASQGLDFSMNGDKWYTLDWSGIHEKTSSTIAAGTAEGAKKGFDGAKDAAKDAGEAAGQAWSDTFEKLLKSNVSPQIAALSASGLSDEQALAIINSQSSKGEAAKISSYDVLGSSISVARESAKTGYFETIFKDGEQVGESTFNLYSKLGKESSNEIGDAYYKSFRSSIRDSGAFMEDQYSKISKSVGEVVADGVFAPVEKKQLEAYKSILETFQKEMPLSFSADDSKLLANIDSIIQGKTFKLDVEAMVKPVYEDWKSAAYQEKFFYENKDVTKQLTREQATALAGTKADFATIIENKDNKYSPQQVNLAKEGNQAIDNVFTAVQDGTGSTAGLMGTSISVLQKIDSSILNQGTWLSQLVAAYNKSSAQSFATGSMKGQYYSWYGGQSAYSTSTGGYQSSAPLATADTASWIDKLYYKVPHLATGGKTTKAGLAYIGEETEYIIPESKLNPAEGKFYSGMWAQDEIDSRLRITPPVSAFQSSAKSGTVPIMTTGSPILNPWTDSPILNPNYMLQMQAAWSGNSLVKPSAGVSNPKVVDYAGQLAEAQRNAAITTDKYANVQDANLKAVLQQSDMLLLKTAADGKYCEAVSDFAIAQEEAKGLFYDSYIGPSGAYSKAKSLGALSMRDNQPEYISKRLEEIKDDTKDIKESTKKTASGLENLKTGSSANPIMTYDGLGGSKAIQITQAMIDAARANEDEYAQITMGLQPFTYGLAQFSAENGKFCQAISDFGLAQEYSGNFMASYVGVSNDAYAQMKAAEAQYGPNSEAVKALGQTLGIVPAEGWGPNQVSTTEQTDASTQLLQRTGIGFGSLANLGDRTLSATREMAKSSAKTEINTEKISTNTANFPSFMSGMGSFFGTMTYGSGGGGSGALNSRGGFGGSMGSFYGSSWYGGGAAGLSAAFGSAPASSWMNAAATSIGGSGAIQWAKGGLVASPTFFQDAQGNMNVVGETFEPELILPLNDHKRTMELIAANIPMARRFANGGMVGGGNVSAAFGGVTLHYAPVINGSGLSEAALQRVLRKERKDTLEQVEAKLYRDRKR